MQGLCNNLIPSPPILDAGLQPPNFLGRWRILMVVQPSAAHLHLVLLLPQKATDVLDGIMAVTARHIDRA